MIYKHFPHLQTFYKIVLHPLHSTILQKEKTSRGYIKLKGLKAGDSMVDDLPSMEVQSLVYPL